MERAAQCLFPTFTRAIFAVNCQDALFDRVWLLCRQGEHPRLFAAGSDAFAAITPVSEEWRKCTRAYT